MFEAQKPEFGALIKDVLAFYKQNASSFALDVWWQACKGYDIEQVRKALTAHCMDAERGQFPPKPADLVRALEGTATDRAMIAWGKVLEAMQRVGGYTDVVFDDPAIHAVVQDLGGWPKVCRTETAELSYLQHRFCEAYRAYAGRGQFEYPRKLTGDRSPDHEYSSRGIPVPKPAVVGEVERARLVYAGGQRGGKTNISRDVQSLVGATVAKIGMGPKKEQS